jgi:putative cell wall-binding protein
VIILSSEIPVTGRVFKESVKVCTPKSPPPTDDAALNLAALNVFAHRPGIQPEHFRCLPESEKAVSNRFSRCLFLLCHVCQPFQQNSTECVLSVANGYLCPSKTVPSQISILVLPGNCPLCLSRGQLSRTEVLERLGMKDFSRVAQLSAEEAIRLVLTKEKESEQTRWSKFDAELTKRVADLTEKHQAELQKHQTEKHELTMRLEEFERNSAAAMQNAKQHERLTTEKELQPQLVALNGRVAELEAAQTLADQRRQAEVTKVKAELDGALNIANAKANDLERRVKDYSEEMNKLRERNQELEIEMTKVARIGKREELDFAEEVRSWSGIWISDKLSRHGDYLIAFCDAQGTPLEPRMVLDNKDKACIAETDIEKLVRDAKQRNLSVAVIVARDESQLRQIDRKCLCSNALETRGQISSSEMRFWQRRFGGPLWTLMRLKRN